MKNLKQFVVQHRENWNELEKMLVTMRKKGRKVTSNDIHKFHRLYQQSAQNLSYCQTHYPTADITFYLNNLVAMAHNILYKDQVSSFKQIRTFLGTTFIRLLIEQWKFVVIAMVLFLFGTLASFLAVAIDPLNLYTILPDNIAHSVDPTSLGSQDGQVDSAYMSASIMTNNIQVAILAFAGGVTFGILTVYILIYNGIIVGALAGLFWQYGRSYDFWAYIVPHGMIELTAIFIAGGAGLLMGYKLFAPGRYSRIYQLKTMAKRSIQLLLGTVPLFIIAGIIEGYITPSSFSLEVKYAFAFVTVIGLVVYVLIGTHRLNRLPKVNYES